MELGQFNIHHLTNLLEKLSLEIKTLVLLGDFNANLLKYDIDTDISNFLDLMYLSFLFPHIASPIRTMTAWGTLADNMLTNNSNSPYQIETSPLICNAMLCKSMDWFLYD